MSVRVAPGERTTLYGAWLVPFGGAPVEIEQPTYDAARARLIDFWLARLGERPIFEVPEKVVNDAQRSLLDPGPRADLAVQRRQPVRGVLVRRGARRRRGDGRVRVPRRDHGDPRAARSARLKGSNWRIGEKLTATALYYRLSGDRAYLESVTPAIAHLLDNLSRQIYRANGNGLLIRERFSSDIARARLRACTARRPSGRG